MKEEKLLRAVGDVGDDLIHMAQTRQFRPAAWRRVLPMAACLAVLLTLGALTVPKFLHNAEQTPDHQTQEPIRPIPSVKEDIVVPADKVLPDGGFHDIVIVEVEPEPWTRSLGWVVFRDTVYYGQQIYTAEEAEHQMGDMANDSVEKAQHADWKGRAVYERQFTKYRVRQPEAMVDTIGGSINLEAEDGWPVLPEELLVALEDGTYLRCRTSFLADGPLFALDVNAPDEEKLLDWLITPLQQCFGMEEMLRTSDLTAAKTEKLLFAFLEMERLAGHRSEELDKALWYDAEAEVYVLPKADVEWILSRYLDSVSLKFENLEAYDREKQALVYENLAVPEMTSAPALSEWIHTAADTLQVSVYCDDGQWGYFRIYTFRVTEDGIFLQQVIRETAD